MPEGDTTSSGRVFIRLLIQRITGSGRAMVCRCIIRAAEADASSPALAAVVVSGLSSDAPAAQQFRANGV